MKIKPGSLGKAIPPFDIQVWPERHWQGALRAQPGLAPIPAVPPTSQGGPRNAALCEGRGLAPRGWGGSPPASWRFPAPPIWAVSLEDTLAVSTQPVTWVSLLDFKDSRVFFYFQKGLLPRNPHSRYVNKSGHPCGGVRSVGGPAGWDSQASRSRSSTKTAMSCRPTWKAALASESSPPGPQACSCATR